MKRQKLDQKMFHGTTDIIWMKEPKGNTLYLTKSYEDAMAYATEVYLDRNPAPKFKGKKITS